LVVSGARREVEEEDEEEERGHDLEEDKARSISSLSLLQTPGHSTYYAATRDRQAHLALEHAFIPVLGRTSARGG
jgi:hypothetical protein